LVVTRDCVGKPTKFGFAEGVSNCGVAAWDWHGDDFSDGVERNVVNAEAPDKVVNVSHILLMWLRSQERLREPCTVVNLFHVTEFDELSNGFLNNRLLSWTKRRVFAGNRPCVTSVDLTLVVLDGKWDTLFTEDSPILFDEISKFKLARGREVGNIKMFTKHATVYGLIVFDAEVWVDISQGRGRVTAFAYKASSFDFWEHRFPVILRVWMTSVMKQGANVIVWPLLRFRLAMLRGKTNWRQGRRGSLESLLGSIRRKFQA